MINITTDIGKKYTNDAFSYVLPTYCYRVCYIPTIGYAEIFVTSCH